MFAGGVQVVEHVADGPVVAVMSEVLPFVTNVPASGNVLPPLVKVVAEIVTCQPAPVPVASPTVYCWSAGTVSTRLWSEPVSVPAQLSDAGEARVRVPPVSATDPVISQSPDVGAVGPQAAAPAGPDSRAAEPAVRPPVRTTSAANERTSRRMSITHPFLNGSTAPREPSCAAVLR